MTLPALLSPEAEADLDEAAGWYERKLAGLGAQMVGEVRNELVRMGDFPRRIQRCGPE
jgi:hypothetical protein